MGEIAVDTTLLELVTALVEGPFEEPLWDGFLKGLCAATQADYAMLLLKPPGRPMDAGYRLAFGDDQTTKLLGLYSDFVDMWRPAASLAREGQPISLRDLSESDGGPDFDFCQKLSTSYGITGLRLIRVTEPKRVDGWLMVARRGRDFHGQSVAILTSLVRPLRATLQAHVDSESGKFRSRMAAEAVRRMQCGWLLLDEHAHILAADQFGETILAQSRVLSRTPTGRLLVHPSERDAEVSRLISHIAVNAEARPKAISLRSDPWLDMLIVQARKKVISDTAVPAVIAYVHGDNWSSTDRCSQLEDLFDLSPNEARLALAMCRGKNLVEAAADLGLAIETVRSYSKVVYAKTGTRGMADLVRVIMSSILTIAPDD